MSATLPPASETTPSPGSASSSKAGETAAFAPIACSARIVRDSAKKWSGSCMAQIAPQGLVLYPPSGDPVVVRPGTKVKYLGDNRLLVTLPGEGEGLERELSLKLKRGVTYQNMLTLDTVAYLNGDIPKLNASYNVPLWLFIPALLPLGLPFLVFRYVPADHPNFQFGMIAATVAGLLLAMFCLLLAMLEKTKPLIRVAACVLTSLLAYVFTASLVGAMPMPDVYTLILGKPLEKSKENELHWESFTLKDLDCRVGGTAAPVKEKEFDREVSDKKTVKFVRYASRNMPQIDFVLDSAIADDEIKKSYLAAKALHEKDLKEDYPDISTIEMKEVEHPSHSQGDKHAPIMGVEIRGTLANGQVVIRQVFVLRNRIYASTTVTKQANVPQFYRDQFMNNVIVNGLQGRVQQAQRSSGG